MKTLNDFLTEQIESMSTGQLINLNNSYCDYANYEDYIRDNDDDFFNTYFSNNPAEAVRAASFGDYHHHHNYVKINGYGNLESLDNIDIDNLVESVNSIVEYAIENQSYFDMLDFDFEEDEESLTDED